MKPLDLDQMSAEVLSNQNYPTLTALLSDQTGDNSELCPTPLFIHLLNKKRAVISFKFEWLSSEQKKTSQTLNRVHFPSFWASELNG